MATSEIIKIISSKTGLSEDEILTKIRDKQEELSGLVSEEGAAYIVANELNVKMENRILESAIPIADIQNGMKSATVNGRIMRIFGPHKFKTKKGKEGKVANILIADKSGSIRVALWNMSDIEKIEKNEIRVGDIVQVKNGYVRPGYQGGLEINLGTRGSLITNLNELDDKEFPESIDGQSYSKIKDLIPGARANIIAKVKSKFEVKEFEKNGRSGKVANLIVSDETGNIRLVLWNEKTSIMDELNLGDILKINNGLVKEGIRGLEVHANNFTRIEKNPVGVELKENTSERIHIKDISDIGKNVEIRATVTDFFGERFSYNLCPNCNKRIEGDVCEKCGKVKPKKLLVLNLMVDDGTGLIRVALFGGVVKNFLGMDESEIEKDSAKVKEKVRQIIGTEFIFSGVTKMNSFTGKIELNARSIAPVNPEKEAERILRSIENSEV